MSKPSKYDWQVAEVLADANDSLVLWLIDRRFCLTHQAFRAHFGADFPLNDILESLKEGGFIDEHDGELGLTDKGAATVSLMTRSAREHSAAALIAADMDATTGEPDLLAQTESSTIGSIEEEMSKCLRILENTVPDESDAKADEIREYTLARLNVFVLLQAGHGALVGEFLGNFCPVYYQQSLALVAIKMARSRTLEEAFTLALGVLAQFIDPEVLIQAAKFAAELNRVAELEETLTKSRQREEFRRLLRSQSRDWTKALLNRIGLQGLEHTLARAAE